MLPKFAGEGCTCAAYYSGECCCDADWTDPEVYKLRQALKRLYKAYKRLDKQRAKDFDDYDGRFYKEPILKYIEELINAA